MGIKTGKMDSAAGIFVDTSDLEKRLGTLSSRAGYVLSEASNRAATTAKKTAMREVKAKYLFRKEKVNQAFSQTKASAQNPSASVFTRGTRDNLIFFKVSPGHPPEKGKRERGYKAKVMKQRSHGKYLAGAFVQRVRSGENGEFVGLFRRKPGSRTKLEGVAGPSVPDVAGSRAIMDATQEAASQMMQKRIKHNIDRILQ